MGSRKKIPGRFSKNRDLKVYVLFIVLHNRHVTVYKIGTFAGFGLGFWSEQASESVHHDFNHFWETRKFKPDLGDDNYDSNLLKCIVAYNSRHI